MWNCTNHPARKCCVVKWSESSLSTNLPRRQTSALGQYSAPAHHLKLLIQGVDKHDPMTGRLKCTDEVCFYQRTAWNNSFKHYIKPGKGRRVPVMVHIQILWQKTTILWSSIRRHNSMRGRIHVSVALRQIEGVIVNLPAVTEGLSVIDPDSDTCISVWSGTSCYHWRSSC